MKGLLNRCTYVCTACAVYVLYVINPCFAVYIYMYTFTACMLYITDMLIIKIYIIHCLYRTGAFIYKYFTHCALLYLYHVRKYILLTGPVLLSLYVTFDAIMNFHTIL